MPLPAAEIYTGFAEILDLQRFSGIAGLSRGTPGAP
jgi:hypothetical protein